MKLKLNTENGFVFIDPNTVTNFGPYLDEGKNDTRIEHLSASGELKTEIVKHDFYKVTAALATLWSLNDAADKAG